MAVEEAAVGRGVVSSRGFGGVIGSAIGGRGTIAAEHATAAVGGFSCGGGLGRFSGGAAEEGHFGGVVGSVG